MNNYNFDKDYLKKYSYLAGVDEAGRGPLAGPVVAVAVILDLSNNYIYNLNDSKALSSKQRLTLYDEITKKCLSFGVSFISNEKIDEINIYNASKLAMIEAIKKLKIIPDVIITDAMPLNFEKSLVFALKKADTLSASVMAASIIAKVERDRFMEELHLKYPQYAFEKNKGYPTKEHQNALKKYGPSPYHRKSFRLNY